MKRILTVMSLSTTLLVACERPQPVGGNCERAEKPEIQVRHPSASADFLAETYVYYSNGSCPPSPAANVSVTCKAEGCEAIPVGVDDVQNVQIAASGPGEVPVEVSYEDPDTGEKGTLTASITFTAEKAKPLAVGSTTPTTEDELVVYTTTKEPSTRYSCRATDVKDSSRWGLDIAPKTGTFHCLVEKKIGDGTTRLPMNNWSSDRTPDAILCTAAFEGEPIRHIEAFAWTGDALELLETTPTKMPNCTLRATSKGE